MITLLLLTLLADVVAQPVTLAWNELLAKSAIHPPKLTTLSKP